MNSLELLPPDPLFDLLAAFKNDSNPHKVNLGIGAYVADNGGPFVLPIIQQVANELSMDNFNYLPIKGDPYFLEQTSKLVLGENLYNESQYAMQATCGGTQACDLFANLTKTLGIKTILFPTPTWPNHEKIFSGFSLVEFPHLNNQQEFNTDGYTKALQSLNNEPAILLLHGGSTHNPTGINFAKEDLEQLLPLIKEKKVFVFVDFAYLGLGSSIESDAKLLRHLVSELPQIAIAFSYSKNATLYSHRTGALLIKTAEKEILESHLQRMVRTSISNPPSFGQMIMNEVFKNQKEVWFTQLDQMRQSIDQRKLKLISGLGGSIDYLDKTSGMFGLLSVTPKQVDQLKKEYSVYLPASGRISFAGIQLDSLDYLINSLKQVIG